MLDEFPYVPVITPVAIKSTDKEPLEVTGVEETDNVEELNPTEVTVPIPLPGSPIVRFVAKVILPSGPIVICGIVELLPYKPGVTDVEPISKFILPLVVLGEFDTDKLLEAIPIEVKPCVGTKIVAVVAAVNWPFALTVIIGT
jgi:hypothetical protein